MILVNIEGVKVTDVVSVCCDECGSEFRRTIKIIKSSRKKWNRDICKSCSYILSSNKKPQCSKEYWQSAEVKKNHSLSIKSSDIYYNSLKNRPDILGNNNPMYGKSHTLETKRKMSISRTGKTGENATGWKGGKSTITRLVKGFQNRSGWYKSVYERDSFKCVKCGSKDKIEAHHIKPVKSIVDEFEVRFTNKDDLYEFLIELDIIKDTNLDNGITLCRECHKKEHTNFGSHNPISYICNII